MPDFSADAGLLFDTVREAGALALTMMRQNVRRWQKSDGSPVTEGDLAVDALLKSRLQTARPGYGWLSEETPDGPDRLARQTLWIADPIDGTRAFIAGGPNWGVAVALVHMGQPVAAAVYCPFTEEFFSAIAGQGAVVNGVALAASGGGSLGGATIAGSRKALAGLSVHGITADTSGALPLQLRLAHVAAGRLDGAVSYGNKNDWDLAAGGLLVAEAGGRVGGTDGAPHVYNRPDPWQQGMIAAGAQRFTALTEALNTP